MTQVDYSDEEIDYPYPINPAKIEDTRQVPKPEPASQGYSYPPTEQVSYSPPPPSQPVQPDPQPGKKSHKRKKEASLPPVYASSSPAALEITVGVITFLVLLAIIAAVIYFFLI